MIATLVPRTLSAPDYIALVLYFALNLGIG